jgi:hypothetical protein
VLESTVSARPGDILFLSPVKDRIRWFDPETQDALA